MDLEKLSKEMFDWARTKKLYCNLKVGFQGKNANTKYSFDMQPRSYKVVHSFIRDFPIIKAMDRKPSYDTSRLRYTKVLTDKKGSYLTIDLYGVSIMPSSCKVEYKEVWVEEKVVPKHVEEGHFEKRAKVVCNNDKEK